MTEVEPQSPVPESYVCEEVRRALATDPRVGELGLCVSIAGGRAFVSGDVATPERRAAISAVVSEVLPGYEVHNDVSVVAVATGSATETLA